MKTRFYKPVFSKYSRQGVWGAVNGLWCIVVVSLWKQTAEAPLLGKRVLEVRMGRLGLACALHHRAPVDHSTPHRCA